MDTPLKVPPLDQLHASAIMFLIDGGAEKAASVLLSCSIIHIGYHRSKFQGGKGFYIITVRAPHPSYLLITKGNEYNDIPPPDVDWEEWYKSGSAEAEIVLQIQDALQAVLPDDIHVGIDVRAELIETNHQWQQKFVDTLYESNRLFQYFLVGVVPRPIL